MVVLDELSVAISITRDELFQSHTCAVLQSLAAGCDAWTKHSHAYMLFEAVLSHAGRALGAAVPLLVNVLASSLRPERDVEMRLRQGGGRVAFSRSAGLFQGDCILT